MSNVELTTSKDQSEIEGAWADHLLYKGKNLFNILWGGDKVAYDKIDKYIGIGEEDEYIGIGEEDEDDEGFYRIDGQEVYLGYLPTEDLFVAGYDMWDPEFSSAVVYFSIDESGEIRIVSKKTQFLDGFYGREISSGYKHLKHYHTDLLNIRLD